MSHNTASGLLKCIIIAVIVLSTSICYAQSVNYAYDELNRLKRVDGIAVEYTYDSAGNRLEIQSLPVYTITVAKTGAGSGTVSGVGFNCGSDCSETKPFASVILTASPGATSYLSGWSNCDSPNGNQCTMNYDATKTVTATFSVRPQLTVTKSGAQQGTVTSSPSGINCGSTCTTYFDANATVTLSTTVPPDYHANWIGCTPNGNTCTLNMGTSNKTVSVTYVIDPKLTVSKSGTTQGTVTSNPGVINCGTTCFDYFPVDTNISLTSSNPSGRCVNWTGCTSNYSSCSLNIGSTDKTVTAAYQTNKKLYVTRTGTSKKTITSDQGGINCGTNCNQAYAQDLPVTLTSATPATGMHVEWSGCDSNPTALQCFYKMDCVDHTVTANFANNHTLTVTKSDGGTVTSSPSGINCGATCSAAYGDTFVTLTATPASGYYVENWSGCGSTNGNICYVTVNANKTVNVLFMPLTVITVSKVGSGMVTGTDVNCGSDCISEGIPGNQVTLTASPATGYVFSEWIGCASHSHANSTCVATYPHDAGGGNGYVYPFFAPNSSSTRNLTLVINAPTDPSCGGTYGVEGGTQYSFYYGSNPSPTTFSATQVVKISRDTTNCYVVPSFTGCDVVITSPSPWIKDCYVLMSSDRTVTTGSN